MASAATDAGGAAGSDTSMQAVIAEGGKCSVVQRDIPVPTGREVLIKIAYTGINRLDLLQASGKYKVPSSVTSVLGLEASGSVAAVGPDCTTDIAKVGTKVFALLIGGGYAGYAVVDERHVMPLVGTEREAAAIAETWLTAFQILITIGDVQKDDFVLVHAAGSSVGIAAIQLAVSKGAKVIATAGAQEKLDTAKRLGAAAGFNRKDGSWEEGVLEATGGKGVDLILDCVGSSYLDMHTNVIAVDGRWVLYGLLSGPAVDGPFLGKLMRKRIKLQATTLRMRSVEYKAKLVADFAAYALPKFTSGDFSVVIDSEYALADVSDALAHVASNKSHGKVLLKI